MSTERLTRLSITVFVTIIAALLLAVYLGWDADRTQDCIDKGYSEGECGWR